MRVRARVRVRAFGHRSCPAFVSILSHSAQTACLHVLHTTGAAAAAAASAAAVSAAVASAAAGTGHSPHVGANGL